MYPNLGSGGPQPSAPPPPPPSSSSSSNPSTLGNSIGSQPVGFSSLMAQQSNQPPPYPTNPPSSSSAPYNSPYGSNNQPPKSGNYSSYSLPQVGQSQPPPPSSQQGPNSFQQAPYPPSSNPYSNPNQPSGYPGNQPPPPPGNSGFQNPYGSSNPYQSQPGNPNNQNPNRPGNPYAPPPQNNPGYQNPYQGQQGGYPPQQPFNQQPPPFNQQQPPPFNQQQPPPYQNQYPPNQQQYPGGHGGFSPYNQPPPQQQSYQSPYNAYPPQGAGYNNNSYGAGGPVNDRLRAITGRYEINDQLAQRLNILQQFEIVILCDDSGSMNTPVDGTNGTRWDELRAIVQIVMEIGAVFDSNGVDVHFLNRPPMPNVTDSRQVMESFSQRPGGLTPLTPALRRIFQSAASKPGSDKRLLVFVATDGAPTDANGNVDIQSLENVMRNERQANTTFVTFLACTDDEASVSYLSQWDRNMMNVDVVDDYKSEREEIRRSRGPNYPFSFGDYVAKALLGAVDPTMDQLDEWGNNNNNNRRF